jgi:hypothetical protein
MKTIFYLSCKSSRIAKTIAQYKLGLIVFDTELISRDDPVWKKATWKKMLIY